MSLRKTHQTFKATLNHSDFYMKLLALVLTLVGLALPAWAVPVAVTVVGPDDKPIENVQLSLVEGSYASNNKPVPRDVTGTNGRFDFEWDGTFPEKKLPNQLLTPADIEEYQTRRYLYVRVSAPGWATETRSIKAAQTVVHLQPGRAWSGLILDADEKPVAGVPLIINNWRVPRDADQTPDVFNDLDATALELASFNALSSQWQLKATTDANGRWKMDGLPARAQVSLALDDARFVKKSYTLSLRPDIEAPALFVRPGATITGQIVTPDGAPIADLPVYSNWNGGDGPRTDAQGHFTLSGLEPGEVALRARDYSYLAGKKDDVGYVVPARNKVQALAGKTTDIGQWRAVKGILAKAKVVNAQTKAPVVGARLNFYGGGNSTASDDKGEIQTRVLPEELRDGSSVIGNVGATGYVSGNISRPLFEDGAETLELGTLEIRPGVSLSGTARVEGEDRKKPVGLPNLTLSNGGDSASIYFWGGRAEFTTQALAPGSYKVALGYDGQGKNKRWEIVSPTNVTVPAPGADKPAPIEIVLKRLATAPPILGEISGRVVDQNGQGVGGAVVTVSLRAGAFGNTNQTAISLNDGSFTVETPNYLNSSATSVEIGGVERPGYLLASVPHVETKDGHTLLSDITLKRRGAVFAGRVVGADGQPVGGAWVAALEARDFAPIQTRADGSFEMRDLPLENFTLIGAHGNSYGQVAAQASVAGVALQLKTPATPDREKLADVALQGALQWWNIGGYWDALGTARVAELAARDGDARGGMNALSFANELAKRDPAEFLKRAPALLETLKDEPRAALEAKLMTMRAQSENADERIAANDWLDGQKEAKRQINAASVTQLLQMAVVARKLKRDDADNWLDYAAAIAAQIGAGNGVGQGWGDALGELGYDSIAHFVDGMKPLTEFGIWAGAADNLAQNGDVVGAKNALKRLQELAVTPELIEQNKNQDWNSPANQIAEARRSVAVAPRQNRRGGRPGTRA